MQKAIKGLHGGNDNYTAKQPASMEYVESDVSAKDSGRTEDAKMHKKYVATKVSLKLKWSGLTSAEISAIYSAFNFDAHPESFSVLYLSPKANGYVRKTFYVGDRTAPLYNATLGIWESLSFTLIEV